MTPSQQEFLRNLDGIIDEMVTAAVSSRIDDLVKNAIADRLEDKFVQVRENLASYIRMETALNKMCLSDSLRIQIQDLIHDTLSKTTFVSTTPTKI